MLVFGLTGNTGTGKTSVADLLRERDIPVVDADRIARAIVAPGEPALAEIARAFGAEYLDDTGHLRRQALGRLVFGDPEARRLLEAITHPRIAAQALRELRDYRVAGAQMAVYDSAILVETGQAGAFAGLIVVTAPAEQQLSRIMARDGLTRRDATQRIDAQMPLSEKVALADFVIDNSASLQALGAKVDELVAWMAKQVPRQGA